MRYSEKLLNCFHHRQHAGILQGADVISVRQGNEQQGEVFELYLQINGDKIIAARFRASGSAALLAALEFVCNYIENKNCETAKALKPQHILRALDLSDFKMHTANLICRALQELLR